VLRYDGETLDIAAISERLVAELEDETISAVILRAESGVQLGSVVGVFDALANAGVEALALGESGREQALGQNTDSHSQANSGIAN
jgi:biopolymer transport protein ExbD